MNAEETNDEKKDDENEDENIKTVEIKPKKKTAAQYLAGEVIPKVENRSAKANLNSMKANFLTAKKKFAAIQPECLTSLLLQSDASLKLQLNLFL